MTGDGTGETQYTTTSTVDSFVAAALGFTGRVVLTARRRRRQRDKLSWWENRPLYGWKVLVPRTKEQAGAMSARLRAYGAIPCEVPTIAVEPPRTPAQMERAVKGLVDGRYAWVDLHLGQRRPRGLGEVRRARPRRPPLRRRQDRLHRRGHRGRGPRVRHPARAGARPATSPREGLLAEFSPHDEILDPVGRVLLPRADIATETLAAGLTERGWEVDDVTAYRTVRAAPPPAEIRDAIKSGGFDAVLFTSSSTVRNLVGIAGKPHARTVVAVIGPKTAETATEFGLRVDVQPAHASVPDLVEALAVVRRRTAREAGRDAGQAAPRLEGAGADRAAVPLTVPQEDVMSFPDDPAAPAAAHAGDAPAGRARPGWRRPSWCCRCSSRKG